MESNQRIDKIIPPLLKKGDKVIVLSTARKIQYAEIQRAIQIYKSWGLEVMVGKSIGSECNQFAGTDELRMKDLQTALDDTSIKAIFCARGGYGTSRLLLKLSLEKFIQNPKWVVGYSDVTALHSFLSANNIASIHAEMPIILDKIESSHVNWTSLKEALFNGKVNISWNTNSQKEALFEANVLGGNLSVLYSLIGTKYLPSFRNSFLFLEDLDEYLYHIDRMMLNLSLSNNLADLKGILIGSFTKMNDNVVPFGESAEQIVVRNATNANSKSINNLPVGHSEINMALFLNVYSKIEINKNGQALLTQELDY